jgi:hypothetical protein
MVVEKQLKFIENFFGEQFNEMKCGSIIINGDWCDLSQNYAYTVINLLQLVKAVGYFSPKVICS